MATTIQISNDLLDILKARKMSPKDSYENVIWDMIEDSLELSEETKRNMAIAEKDIKEGRVISFEELKKKWKLKHVHH